MIRSWPDDKKRNPAEMDENWMKVPIVFPLCRSGSIGGGDVRALLRELKSRYEVTTEEHSDGFSGFRMRGGETIREDRIGGGLQRRWLEKKQMVKKETGQNTLREEEGPERVGLTEQALVNPAYLDQLVTIGGNLSEGCKDQLKTLLKKSMNVFA
ncbi:hypothetical protein Tco_0480633 [Tanacetum coccineum]